jgi:hypothetical protein
MKHPEPVARRLYELTEPIALVNFFSEEPNEAMVALGFRNCWDGYFAGRSAPLGRVPAEVVHAAFYNFADGEVARHIPQIWSTTTPEAAQAAREQGCVAALRTILGDLSRHRSARAAALLAKASTSAPTFGRVMYGGLRALPIPEAPVARLWHSANMLREHRGTATSLPWSPNGSAESRLTSSAHSAWASFPRSRSAGSTPPRGIPDRGHDRSVRPRPSRSLRPLDRGRARDQGPDRITDRRAGRGTV